MSQAGYTLVEMLAALAILGLAHGAPGRGVQYAMPCNR